MDLTVIPGKDHRQLKLVDGFAFDLQLQICGDDEAFIDLERNQVEKLISICQKWLDETEE